MISFSFDFTAKGGEINSSNNYELILKQAVENILPSAKVDCFRFLVGDSCYIILFYLKLDFSYDEQVSFNMPAPLSTEQSLSAFKQIVDNYLNALSDKREKALRAICDEPESEFSCDHCGGGECVYSCIYGYDTEEYWEFLNEE